MKNLKLYIILLGIISSFYFFNKKIGESTVHKMVQSDFRIDVMRCGCFGCGTETVTAFKNNGKRWLRVVPDSEKPTEYELTPEKETQLEMLLNKLIEKNGRGGCTTWAEFVFENSSFRFKVIDNGCILEDFF